MITPGRLNGDIKAIPSKSDGHRCLICAALSDRPTSLQFSSLSEDIQATMDCLAALGAKIEIAPNSNYIVHPIQYDAVPKTVRLDCRESGSTLRFLLPLASYLAPCAEFTGQGRLPERPLAPLVQALSCHGCFFSGPALPFTVIGRLSAGIFDMPGNISSQFLSGLLFALPLLDGQNEICLTSSLESSDYVEMTLSALSRFGITVDRTRRGFAIPGGQAYHSPESVSVDGDWSNAAFFLAAGALGNAITYAGLDKNSLQGDKRILSLLSKFGASIEKSGENGFTASPGLLKACEIDVSQIPDLLPVLAVVAAVSEGTSVFTNAGRLRLKESDRLSSTSGMLRALGAQVSELPEGLEITGKSVLPGGEVDSLGDHRIAMAAAIASIRCRNNVLIHHAQAVNKSYPDFFSDFNRLGGKAHVI
ncbi:MAG: 3-phosphoshikimate 1-carboxyvinyltransferase [Christensenellales bacterium]